MLYEVEYHVCWRRIHSGASSLIGEVLLEWLTETILHLTYVLMNWTSWIKLIWQELGKCLRQAVNIPVYHSSPVKSTLAFSYELPLSNTANPDLMRTALEEYVQVTPNIKYSVFYAVDGSQHNLIAGQNAENMWLWSTQPSWNTSPSLQGSMAIAEAPVEWF